jgi:hypothetical protein
MIPLFEGRPADEDAGLGRLWSGTESGLLSSKKPKLPQLTTASTLDSSIMLFR